MEPKAKKKKNRKTNQERKERKERKENERKEKDDASMQSKVSRFSRMSRQFSKASRRSKKSGSSKLRKSKKQLSMRSKGGEDHNAYEYDAMSTAMSFNQQSMCYSYDESLSGPSNGLFEVSVSSKEKEYINIKCTNPSQWSAKQTAGVVLVICLVLIGSVFNFVVYINSIDAVVAPTASPTTSSKRVP